MCLCKTNILLIFVRLIAAFHFGRVSSDEGEDFVLVSGCVEVLCGHFHNVATENRGSDQILNAYFSLFATHTPDLEIILTHSVTVCSCDPCYLIQSGWT